MLWQSWRRCAAALAMLAAAAAHASPATVLFQLRNLVDGKEVASGDPNRLPRIYLARFAEGQAPTRAKPQPAPGEPGAQGWRTLSLEPGRYFMLVLPPGAEQNPPGVAFHAASGRFGILPRLRKEPVRGARWSPEIWAYALAGEPPEDFQPIPGFWFEVPAGAPLVYVGTLEGRCRGGLGLFGGLVAECTGFHLSVDEDGARRVASLAFAQSGAPSVEPMAPYGRPRQPLTEETRTGIEIDAPAPADLGAAFAGERIGGWNVLPGSTRAANVYNVFAIMIELQSRSEANREAEASLQALKPCLGQLAPGVSQIDLRGAFERALGATPPGAAARLVIALPLLRLRGGEATDRLSLEVGAHLRLEVPPGGPVAYESVIVSGGPHALQNPFTQGSLLYQRPAAGEPESRPVEEWCGPEGREWLRRAFADALERIGSQLSRDLREAGPK